VAAPIQLLAWELPYATGLALKKKKGGDGSTTKSYSIAQGSIFNVL